MPVQKTICSETGKEKLTIKERITAHLTVERTCKSVLYHDKDVHESELIEDNGPLGKCLFMGGLIQSAENDSHIYHESLVQPAMCFSQALLKSTEGRKTKRVLIGGGGELVCAFLCLFLIVDNN